MDDLTLKRVANWSSAQFYPRTGYISKPAATSVGNAYRVFKLDRDGYINNGFINPSYLTTLRTLFLVLLGTAGGQVAAGGTGSGDNLTLKSTTHATKGKVIFGAAGTTAYDEVNERLGVGTNAPVSPVHLKSATPTAATFENTGTTMRAFLSYISGLAMRLAVNVDGAGVFSDTAKAAAIIDLFGQNADGSIMMYTANVNNTTPTQALKLDKNQDAQFAGTITLAEAKNIILGSTTGTKIGTATTQKLAFYNSTPIVKPSAYTQTFATADKTHAARTSAAVTNNTGGVVSTTLAAITAGASYAQADMTATKNALASLSDQLAKVRADLDDTAQAVNAVIDDLQALGLIG